MTGPNVVVFGGGHGAAAALRAVRVYAGSITGVITVADDGGSSGRLRTALDVVAVGDLRRCLLALSAHDGPLEALFEHRFTAGTLDGHPVGNLMLAGLIDLYGDLLAGLDAAATLLDCVGRILPSTLEPVVLVAETSTCPVKGQSAIARRPDISSIRLEPAIPSVPDAVLEAIAGADQILLGPGSLFTSVLASVAPPCIQEALEQAGAKKIYVANLREQVPETFGFSLADHVDALIRHGVQPDLVVWDPSLRMNRGRVAVEVIEAPLAFDDRPMHDPTRLAAVVSPLA